MKSVNIFSTAVSASARSWHQPIIIWKVHSWKGKKNWFGASRCTGMKGTKLRFKTRAATSRQSTENCNTQFPSCRCHCPAFSSAISIIQMGGNYCNKYWRASVWEWLRLVLMGHWAGTCELLRNKGLGAQCAVQTVWEWGWGSPVHAGKVRWWENPLWAFPATAGTALFGNCAQLLFFSWRNQKIREDLNCTEIGLAPPGLSFPDAATPWHGGLCWSRGFAYSEETATRIPYPVTSSSSPGCWETGEFLSMTPENITKMMLANSICLQKAFQMKCPEIKTLKHLKVFRMLINSDDLYVLIIHWHCIIFQAEKELFKVSLPLLLKAKKWCLIKLRPTKLYCVTLAKQPVK